MVYQFKVWTADSIRAFCIKHDLPPPLPGDLPACGRCGKRVAKTISVHEPCEECRASDLCEACLVEALAALRSVEV